MLPDNGWYGGTSELIGVENSILKCVKICRFYFMCKYVWTFCESYIDFYVIPKLGSGI